jgi:hypothetical protein
MARKRTIGPAFGVLAQEPGQRKAGATAQARWGERRFERGGLTHSRQNIIKICFNYGNHQSEWLSVVIVSAPAQRHFFQQHRQSG